MDFKDTMDELQCKRWQFTKIFIFWYIYSVGRMKGFEDNAGRMKGFEGNLHMDLAYFSQMFQRKKSCHSKIKCL